MKRILARILIAFFLAGAVGLALPAGAQSHGGSGGHRGIGSHHGNLHSSVPHFRAHAGHHGHRSLVHHHMHSWVLPRGSASKCDRLGWDAHSHHWRSAFDYYALFDRPAGAECVQNDEAAHW